MDRSIDRQIDSKGERMLCVLEECISPLYLDFLNGSTGVTNLASPLRI